LSVQMQNDERARRELVRAIVGGTELVTITVDDPSNQNPDPVAFQAEPEGLFEMTFTRIGLNDDDAMRALQQDLMLRLPEIRDKIQQSESFKPSVIIGLVWNFLTTQLDLATGN
jgi:hypothetical protein